MLHRSRPLQPGAQQQQQQSHLLDLLDVSVNDAAVGWVDPWGTPAHPSEPPVPVMPPRPKVSHLSFFFKRFFFSGNSTPFLERFFSLVLFVPTLNFNPFPGDPYDQHLSPFLSRFSLFFCWTLTDRMSMCAKKGYDWISFIFIF